jgi:alpha-tubulin suppressor-like RCC1 family protein
MPKDDINYKFTENGIVYDFYDVFVPAENFRQPSLWVWGWNNGTELGINATGERVTPVTTFAGGTTWKSVACGNSPHTAAIKTDGTLWVWGKNASGTIGDNTTTQRSTPVTTFAGGNNWKQVSCGGSHTAAIKTDGTLWTWGLSERGQVGNNQGIFTTQRNTPVTTFAGGTNWKSVACGYRITAAIKTDGSLWVWGLNEGGELGDNTTISRSTPVTTFAGGNNWKQVSAGNGHIAAIKTDGTLWTWGRNAYGQLGTNDTAARTTPVTTFAGGNTWKSFDCGQHHTAAIKTDGTLWTWGYNQYGQLGNNLSSTANNRTTPVTTFTGGNNWKQVSGGSDQTMAVKTDGTLWVWGMGNVGRLGNNSNSSNVPVTTFAGGNNWKQVSTAAAFGVAIQYTPDP